MKKVEMIIRPEKLEAVKESLNAIGVGGMTVTSVMGCGTQKGKQELYRGAAVPVILLHKFKVEAIIHDDMVEQAVKVIREATCTNTVGDGKIFIIDVENAIRIRPGEQGPDAI